jgi:hypothetical protein
MYDPFHWARWWKTKIITSCFIQSSSHYLRLRLRTVKSSRDRLPAKFQRGSRPPIFLLQQEGPQQSENQSCTARVLRSRKGKRQIVLCLADTADAGQIWHFCGTKSRTTSAVWHRAFSAWMANLRLPAAINHWQTGAGISSISYGALYFYSLGITSMRWKPFGLQTIVNIVLLWSIPCLLLAPGWSSSESELQVEPECEIKVECYIVLECDLTVERALDIKYEMDWEFAVKCECDTEPELAIESESECEIEFQSEYEMGWELEVERESETEIKIEFKTEFERNANASVRWRPNASADPNSDPKTNLSPSINTNSKP